MKNRIIATIILITVLISVAGCGTSSDKADTSGVLFSIGEYRVTYGEALILVMGQKVFTEGNYGSKIWDVDIDGNKLGSFLLDKIKNHIALIYSGADFAKSEGISLSSEDKTLVNSAANYFYSGLTEQTKDTYDIDLEMIQRVYSAYRLSVIGHDKLVEDAGIEVSQDEARVMVLAQIRVYTTGLTEDELVIKNEKINIIKEKLAAGEDFVSLATAYSEADEIQRTVSRDDLPDGEEKIAFNLGVNQISDVCENADGYYVFKCLKSNDRTLSEARRQQLLEKSRDEYYLNRLKAYLQTEAPDFREQIWNYMSFDNPDFSAGYDFYSVYDMFFPEI